MRYFLSLALLTYAGFYPVHADGLVHQLTADVTSARFDLVIKISENGMEKTGKGTMDMASVGQVDVDGKKCRWIEFRLKLNLDGIELTTIAKALIPESALKAGENPGAAMVRGWLQDQGRDSEELKDIQSQRAGPLPAFLAGPLQNVKKLDKTVIDNKALGKIECTGEKGTTGF